MNTCLQAWLALRLQLIGATLQAILLAAVTLPLFFWPERLEQVRDATIILSPSHRFYHPSSFDLPLCQLVLVTDCLLVMPLFPPPPFPAGARGDGGSAGP